MELETVEPNRLRDQSTPNVAHPDDQAKGPSSGERLAVDPPDWRDETVPGMWYPGSTKAEWLPSDHPDVFGDWPFSRDARGRRVWKPLGWGTDSYVVPDDRAEALRRAAERYDRSSYTSNLRYSWWVRSATRDLERAAPPLRARGWLRVVLVSTLMVCLLTVAAYVAISQGWLGG